MSTNKNLFKEAIADAKAVREAALANAKVALEEALTPKLQSMLSAKLQEMEYEEEGAMGGYTDENLDEEDYMQPIDTADEMGQSGFGSREQGKPGFGDLDLEEEDLEEDFDLSEILAELNEADEEEAEEEGEEEEDEEEEEEESEEGENVADMSVEDLKDLIKSIVDQELEAEEAETPAEEEAEYADGEEAGEEVSNEDEIDLEELLAELDSLGENHDDDMEEESMYEAKKKAKDTKKEKEAKEEMKEAVATINALRKEMNEVNLLNAKLLYVNKIFKAKNLTESQKVKVIASFDKATNVKEAKVVFESLNSALRAPAKRTIKESFGFASKASGVAQNRTIVESNDAIKRMQKLANIIK
jgi:hypothetical protein